MIFCRNGEVRATHLATCQPKAIKGLSGGHLMNQVEIDVNEVRFALRTADNVIGPDLLGESFAHSCSFV